MGIPSVAFDIPVIVEMNNVMEKKYNYNADLAHDLSSSICLFSGSIGEMIGPVLGGYLTYSKSFEFSCYVVGVINLLNFILLIVCYKNMLLDKILNLRAALNENNYITNIDTTSTANTAAEKQDLKKVRLIFENKKQSIRVSKHLTMKELKRININPTDKRLTQTSLLYLLNVGPKTEDQAVCLKNNIKAKIKYGTVKALIKCDFNSALL